MVKKTITNSQGMGVGIAFALCPRFCAFVCQNHIELGSHAVALTDEVKILLERIL